MNKKIIDKNLIIKAELIAAYDCKNVKLLGERTINNLRDIIIESLLYMTEYSISKNEDPLYVYNEIVVKVNSDYKKNLYSEYEKYITNPNWLEDKFNTKYKTNYKCEFTIALLEKERRVDGNPQICEFYTFLKELIKEVQYSLMRDYKWTPKEIEIFFENTILVALKLTANEYLRKDEE